MLRENISESICYTAHFQKVFVNFENHSFQIKQQTLMTKLYWWKKEK